MIKKKNVCGCIALALKVCMLLLSQLIQQFPVSNQKKMLNYFSKGRLVLLIVIKQCFNLKITVINGNFIIEKHLNK